MRREDKSPVRRADWMGWVLFCFSRKERKERRDLFPFLFHACAGVVANFVTTRVRRVVSSKFSSSSSSSSLSSSSSSSSFPLREITISM